VAGRSGVERDRVQQFLSRRRRHNVDATTDATCNSRRWPHHPHVSTTRRQMATPGHRNQPLRPHCTSMHHFAEFSRRIIYTLCNFYAKKPSNHMRPLTKLPSVAARTFPVVGPRQRRRRPLSNWRRSVSISSHGSSEDPTQTSSSDPSCINWLTALLFWQFNLEVVLLFRAFMTDWLTDWVYHGFARCKLKFDLSRRSAYTDFVPAQPRRTYMHTYGRIR